MKNSSRLLPKLFLGIATIALLAACDGSDTSSGDNQSRAQEHGGNILSTSGMDNLEPTWSGSYLSSRVAQDRFDWARAETFLAQVNSARGKNDLLQRRLMLLAMGAGNVDDAVKYASTVKAENDDSGLTQLIRMLGPIRDGQLITASTMLGDMPKTALVQFAKPLLQVWLDAAQGKDSTDLLANNPSYYYHRVLLADYLNHIDQVSNMTNLAAVQTLLTAVSAERMGDIFLRHQKYDLATMAYKTTSALSPNTPNIGTKIKASIDKSPLPAGIKLAPPLASPAEGIALALFDIATTFYNEQGFESAQLFAQMSLSLKPDLYEAKLLLGNLMTRNGRIDASIALYQEIPADNPRYQTVQQQIAHLLSAQNRDKEAIAVLEKLMDTTADRDQKIEYLMQIGDIYREGEDFDRALKQYNTAADLLDQKIDADHWEILYARGMTYERLKKWNKAENDLEAALKFRPDHPYLLNYLGYSWADQGIKLDQAVALLLKAVQIVPDDGYVTDSVGWVYYRMKEYKNAVIYLERAVELLPYDPTINDHLGDAYARDGRMREAEFQWHRAYNYSEDPAQKEKIDQKLKAGIDSVASAE